MFRVGERAGLLVELRDYVRELRRGWLLLLASAIVGGLVAAVVTLRQTPLFEATEIMVVSSSDGSDSAASAYQGALLSAQRVKSYASLVASERVTAAVVDRLALDQTPANLSSHIRAQAMPDTMLLRVTVTDPDPRRAQMIADTVGEVFSQAIAAVETPAPDRAPPVRVHVWEKAKLPVIPVSPRPVRSIALGVLLGLIGSVGLTLLRSRLDTSVGTDAEIAAATGFTTLSTVAFDARSAGRPLIGNYDAQSPQAESFRQLRTNLRFADVDSPPCTILVSSAVAAEGKTTTTYNLAVAMATAGAQVALVEADLRRPSFGDYFGIESAAGLTSVLIGAADLDDVLQPWGGTGGRLQILPCGQLPPNPSELLGSRGMSELLADLSSRFDYVLIDAPPLLPVTDAAVLAAQTDGTLLVVRAGRTRREQLAKAANALNAVDARVLGVVLNMIRSKSDAAYYGYPARTDARRTRVRPGRSRRRTGVLDRSAFPAGLGRRVNARREPAGASGDLPDVMIDPQRRPGDGVDPQSVNWDVGSSRVHDPVRLHSATVADRAGRSVEESNDSFDPAIHSDFAADMTTPMVFDTKAAGSHRRRRTR